VSATTATAFATARAEGRAALVGYLPAGFPDVGGGIAALTFAGYAVNRTWGMPGAMDDVGNWLEPLGLASLFVEGAVALLAAWAVTAVAGSRSTSVRADRRPVLERGVR
jgi:hypothetical protein